MKILTKRQQKEIERNRDIISEYICNIPAMDIKAAVRAKAAKARAAQEKAWMDQLEDLRRRGALD